jgi:hypothetical protein
VIRVLTLALLTMSTVPWAATARGEPEVTVSLRATPTEARVGDTIRLEVRVSARGGRIQGLELDDLRKYPQLEIVSHQTVRPMQFSFAFGSGVQVESSLTEIYVLRPTATGTFDFAPAVAKVDGKTYRSQPLTLVVGPGMGVTSDATGDTELPQSMPDTRLSGARFDEDAFLRTVVEPKEVYIGQQVDVTVYLYTRLRLAPQSVSPGKPSMDGFWVHDDPITSLQPQTVEVGGTPYRVYALQRSAAFPQRTGDLTIGAPEVTFDVGGMSLFDTPQRIERQGVPVTVKVRPLPQPKPPNAVVGRYDVRAWLDRETVSTGDAVTLRIDASGVGNIQDLRIDLPPMVGVRVLQPAIRDKEQFQDGKLSGTRSWEWILIAEAPGAHTIPPLQLPYFDPQTEKYGSASTQPLTFTAVGPAKPASAAMEPAGPRPQPKAATFGPIRMYSALARGRVPVRQRSWFAWLLGLPPLLFVLVVLGSSTVRHRERRSTTAGAIQRKLIRSAEDALKGNDPRSFYDRIVDAIHHALESRLGEPVVGLPHAELRNRLVEAGFDEDLVQRVINELEGADFARFAASGVSEDEMQRCLDRTDAIVARLRRSTRSSA